MRLPDQSAPVQRALNLASLRPADMRQSADGQASAFVQGGFIAPSGWEECYDLEGAARELCLGAFRNY